MDYSGTTLFSPRLHSEHKANVILAENETKSKWEEKEHETGSRYSELMKLPYFDCVRCTIIDPMHNLFTGTTKHMLKNIWLNDADCRINGNDMKKIQEQIDQFRTPSFIGKIPHRIFSSFSNFTADQWKIGCYTSHYFQCIHCYLRKS